MTLYFSTDRSVFLQDPSLEGTVWYTVVDSVGPPVISHRAPLITEQIIPCSYNTANSPQMTLDKVAFGDGYEQVSDSGINPVRHNFSVQFTNKRRVVIEALRRFFTGEPEQDSIYDRRPSEWFWWVPPWPLAKSGQLIKVRCEQFTMTHSGFDNLNLSTTFIESFEP